MKSIIISLMLLFSFLCHAEEPTVEVSEQASSILEEVSASTFEESKKPESETEIKLNLDATKSAKSEENTVVKMLLSILVIGAMAGAGFFYIKKSGYRNTKIKANQIKVLTQFHLGPKKSLAIIRVAGESVLIGITDQNISLIKTLSLLDEDIPETTPHQFNTLMERNGSSEKAIASHASEEEDFAMTGIKNIVSQKIKNMRSI